MNPEIQLLPPEPPPINPISPIPPIPRPEFPLLPPAPPRSHRSIGKVARLPKTVRDQINECILDGIPYLDIIQRLGDHGKDLNPDHIHQWKKHGHQHWLAEQAWRETLLLRQESYAELLSATHDPVQLPEAGLQLAVLNVCDLLRSLSAPGAAPNPDQFVRLANSLARLSHSVLQLQQYREASAKAKADQHKVSEADRAAVDKNLEIQRRLVAQLRARLEQLSAHDTSTPVSGTPDQPTPAPALAITSPPVTRAPEQVVPQNPEPSTLNSQEGYRSGASAERRTPALNPPPPQDPQPSEHCLECAAPLPPRNSNGSRPYATCRNCGIPLPRCQLVHPSDERCSNCGCGVPHVEPGGNRLMDICHICGRYLPDPPKTP